MRLALNISGDANRDLEAIADYIGANYGFPSSDRFIAGITARLKQLAQFPMMGPSREEIAPGFRSLNYERYLILYVVQDYSINVMRVVSAYQDLTGLFDSD
jgi:toxin ParE1/3/4